MMTLLGALRVATAGEADSGMADGVGYRMS
jgi:hypothetical protein